MTGDALDVDVGKFIRLRLYPELRRDAQLLGVFGNLTALLLSNESIILYKTLTERERDVEDVAAIVRAGGVDWGRLLEAAVAVTERELRSKGARGIVVVYGLYATLWRVDEKSLGLVPGSVLRWVEAAAEKYLDMRLSLKQCSEAGREHVDPGPSTR